MSVSISQARITEVGRCIRVLHERRRELGINDYCFGEVIRVLGEHKRRMKSAMQAHQQSSQEGEAAGMKATTRS